MLEKEKHGRSFAGGKGEGKRESMEYGEGGRATWGVGEGEEKGEGRVL